MIMKTIPCPDCNGSGYANLEDYPCPGCNCTGESSRPATFEENRNAFQRDLIDFLENHPFSNAEPISGETTEVKQDGDYTTIHLNFPHSPLERLNVTIQYEG